VLNEQTRVADVKEENNMNITILLREKWFSWLFLDFIMIFLVVNGVAVTSEIGDCIIR
jgi:hypothetical protein